MSFTQQLIQMMPCFLGSNRNGTKIIFEFTVKPLNKRRIPPTLKFSFTKCDSGTSSSTTLLLLLWGYRWALCVFGRVLTFHERKGRFKTPPQKKTPKQNKTFSKDSKKVQGNKTVAPLKPFAFHQFSNSGRICQEMKMTSLHSHCCWIYKRWCSSFHCQSHFLGLNSSTGTLRKCWFWGLWTISKKNESPWQVLKNSHLCSPPSSSSSSYNYFPWSATTTA